MKKSVILIAFICASFFSFGQELKLNDDGIYEYDSVINFSDSNLIETLKNRILTLNYNIEQGTNSEIIASRYYSLGTLSGQKVKYRVRIELKDNKYRLFLTNFIIQYTANNQLKEDPLEKTLWKKMWLKNINKELPKLVRELDLNTSKVKKDW
ncbi:MAG: hypothetical protein M1445_01990 [Bacteroidetes bacterium]|nr:hypothetical protein [Bacteroidota bacterium]MCL6101437.1 hypothetical protein [Bacteroidota bacterium]